jgi:hypothetical protein
VLFSASAVALVLLLAKSHGVGTSLAFYRLGRLKFENGPDIHRKSTRSCLPHHFSQVRSQLSLYLQVLDRSAPTTIK